MPATKRRAGASAGPGPKRQKGSAGLRKVVAAVGGCDDLPETCRDMLGRMAPYSLGVAPEDRGTQQAAVIDMIGNALLAIEAKMQDNLQEQKAKLDGSAAEKVKRENAVKVAEEDLAAKKAVVEAKKEALAEATIVVRGKRDNVATAKKEEAKAAKDTDSADEEKATLTRLRDEHYIPLKEGTWEASDVKRKHLKGLEEILEIVDFVDSLKTAVPAVAGKKPDGRGVFDQTVMEQFDTELNNRITALDKTLEAAAPTKARVEAAVANGEKELEDAKAVQKAAAEAEKEAINGEQGEKKAEQELKDAKNNLKKFWPEMQSVEDNHTSETQELQNFQEGPLEQFRSLKDPPAPEEEAEVETEAEAEAEAEEEAPAAEEAAPAAEEAAAPAGEEAPAA